MVALSIKLKRFFPISKISSVVNVFKEEIIRGEDADLVLLSIIVGYIENVLTKSRNCMIAYDVKKPVNKKNATVDISDEDDMDLPTLEFSVVEALHSEFRSLVTNYVDLSQFGNPKFATRDVIKKVSDVIWSTLSRSYFKDKAHLQSLYSYLKGKKLDCFGLSLAVVAGCQVLGFNDVHLALSEDHAWVVFGKDRDMTAEVTWHGKGNEDKRGQPVDAGCEAKSWLYVNGFPVICTREMEVAAIITTINPVINANEDSIELSKLQRKLLWLLFDDGFLSRYPMAIGNLSYLEEINTTPHRLSSLELYEMSISIAKQYYNDCHVYPYTFLGSYYYRKKQYKEALKCWSKAANVIRSYNYSRDDEEIYKEFLEIASDYIPNVMKVVSAGHCARSLTKDPECFALLLNFYDGLCEWEEGSSTPVLHIGWAKPLIATLVKFDAKVRSQVVLTCATSTEADYQQCDALLPHQNGEEGRLGDVEQSQKRKMVLRGSKPFRKRRKSSGNRINKMESEVTKSHMQEHNEVEIVSVIDGQSHGEDEGFIDVNVNTVKTEDIIKRIEAEVNANEAPHPCIVALTAACSENILNPNYLLGYNGSQPFTALGDLTSQGFLGVDENSNDCSQSHQLHLKIFNEAHQIQNSNQSDCTLKIITDKNSGDNGDFQLDKVYTKQPEINLFSQKMIGVKDLLLCDKLNTQAISLQLTAQSQVQFTRRARLDNNDGNSVSNRGD